MVKKLAVKKTPLVTLINTQPRTCQLGNSNVSQPKKWRIGSGTHTNNKLKVPIKEVMMLEN